MTNDARPAPCPRCGAPLAEAGSASGLCPRCLLALGLEDEDPIVVTRAGAGPPPAPEVLAEEFPDLEIEELLGQGGMGTVYRARQRGLDRPVALKVLRAELARDPAFVERFHREARALARLSHPGIVAVHDAGQAGEHLYLLMEYVDGANLRSVLRAGRLASKEVLALVGQLCDALQYAHDEGIVHRDIKPENILVDTRGRARVADFGLAKLVRGGRGDVTLTEAAQAIGTAHYMAPEQIETPGEVDHRADIYALGVVFYEMLTGELPIGRFSAPSEKVEVDVRLDEVVLRTLAKEPVRRYQAASDVKTDVERIGSRPRGSKRKFVRAGRGWKVAAGVLEEADLRFEGSLETESRGRRRRGDRPDGERAPRDGDGQRPSRGPWPWILGGALALAFVPCCLGPALLMTGRRASMEQLESGRAERARAEEGLASRGLWIGGGSAVPSLSALFLATHAIDPEVAERANAVLASVHGRYLALEASRVREVGSPREGALRLSIEAFPDERGALETDARRELERAFGSERWPEVRERLDLATLLPFGEEATSVRIERESDGDWFVDARGPSRTVTISREELEEPWARLWGRFRPPAAR